MTIVRTVVWLAGILTLQACSSEGSYENVGSEQSALKGNDKAPPNGETCAYAVASGWCGQAWMKGTCAKTCSRSSSGKNDPVAASSDIYQACQTNHGVNPTIAALAVAMGAELGRWKPNLDLRVSNHHVVLSATGEALCNNGCQNTRALLGQQTPAVSQLTGGVFSAEIYRSTLLTGFGLQALLLEDLAKGYPDQVPPDHKLTLVGGPVDIGEGACGPHYVFQVDNLDGTALTAQQAANMSNWLCFYGMDGSNGQNCGSNPYIGFFQTSNSCPSDRTCIAIDPTDGDNGPQSSTSSGAAPTYPMNRVYDPSGSLVGTPCITVLGLLGTVNSWCSVKPWTCGFEYCDPI